MIRYLLPALMVATCCPLMADSAATVTEAVNQVSHGSSQTAGTSQAEVGTKLQDGEYLKTGVKSRAELQLANASITRLGANTIFDYSPSTNEIDLQAGTVLFSKPKDDKQMNIKTASVTAAVVGTTGFIQAKGKNFLFGLIEGHARLTINGVTFPVGPGEILRFTPGSTPQVYSYNVPHFLETSPLIIDFHDHLPNQAYIDQEVATYDNLVARGFIAPPTGPVFTEVEGAVPSIPIAGVDSAGKSHQHFNMPPPPPPPTEHSGLVFNPARP